MSRSSKRQSGSKASAAAASVTAPAAAAAAAADHHDEGDDKRSYNDAQYWDQRYVHHLATAAKDSATAESASAPAAKKGAKRGRTADSTATAVGGTAPSIATQSDDITSEWYYSYEELSHILLPALRGVDRNLSVLDLGCGVSTCFAQLQAPQGKKDDPASGAGFTGKCIGLDYSPTVIAHLRKQYPADKHPNLEWVCGDACHLLPELAGESERLGLEQEKPRSKKKARGSKEAEPAAATAASPPVLTDAEQKLFTPGSYGLILDKATSDGMLCSDHTAILTPLIYANVARLLAPNGVFVIASVNEPEGGWFGEYVVSQLIEHGGDEVQWKIEVHTPSNYSDGEEGAPNVYVIRKFVAGAANGRAVRGNTQSQREPYTVKQISY